MKIMFKTVLILSSIFLLARCASVDPGQVAADAATANTKLKVAVGKSEDLTDYSNTVVVPTVYVKFLVSGRTSVSKSGGYQVGKDSNSVHASATYKVLGIDKAYARQISQKVYDDFVAKLRASGYKVLTYADIKDRKYVKEASRDKADSKWGLPVESPRDSSDEYIVVAPSDEQQFSVGMFGVFWEFISSGKPKFDDATIVIPTYTITAPQVWGKGDASYATISAEINTAPGMNLTTANAAWMGAPKFGMGGGNHPGVYAKNQLIDVSKKVGELVKTADTTPTAANAVSKVLSLFGGGGTRSGKSAEYSFTIDRDSYMAGAVNATAEFNNVVAKVAKAAAESKTK